MCEIRFKKMPNSLKTEFNTQEDPDIELTEGFPDQNGYIAFEKNCTTLTF